MARLVSLGRQSGRLVTSCMAAHAGNGGRSSVAPEFGGKQRTCKAKAIKY